MQTIKKTAYNFTSIIDQNGGDPWVIALNGMYYYTKTTGNNVTLWRSENLSTVPNGEKKVIFPIPKDFESIWAPELHRVNDAWIVYMACNRPGEKHLMYALKNTSVDPYEGKWEFSAINGMDENFAIDGTYLEVFGKQYLIWSGCPVANAGAPQYLYIAELFSWNTIKGEKVLLSQPEYFFEMRQNAPINEGPQIQVKNGKINLVYSASPSWENGYCLGLLTAVDTSDLLNPYNWHKHSEPILDGTVSIHSPGHNGFITTKDGKEHWIIYHAARWSHSGFSRSIRLQPFTFNEQNEIEIIQKRPIDSDILQVLPSGDKKRYRLSAESFINKNEVVFDEAALDNTALVINKETQIAVPNELLKCMCLIFFVKTTVREEVELKISLGNNDYTYKIIPSDFYQPLYLNITSMDGSTFAFSSEKELVLLDRIEGI